MPYTFFKPVIETINLENTSYKSSCKINTCIIKSFSPCNTNGLCIVRGHTKILEEILIQDCILISFTEKSKGVFFGSSKTLKPSFIAQIRARNIANIEQF